MSLKVGIIGGGGRVGSCAAFALQCGKIVKEIVLLDANAATAEGEALDLLHGSAYCADQKISAGGYEQIAQCNMIVITAGLRRKPDESRLDLINRNVSLFLQILDSLKAARLRDDAYIFVVSNPVDILTQLALQKLGLPESRVIGLGTMLDTSRFCSLIAAELDLPATQVRALILGEHGDSMIPVWSTATVDGVSLANFPGMTPQLQTKLFERTKGSGAEVISRKGGAGWAVGVAIKEVVEAIALDRKAILPVSSYLRGEYGIRDICLSVPTVVGRGGVEKRVVVELWPKELTGLQASAKALKDTLAKVKA
ncbi:lactate/malate dehydrogenase family protein [Kamptonema cortianum]|nr:lactate/malate dehydrogenase family protein [Oscillatoria laete-virens]MDK3156436.1 lactate/malate dehydrogenase family protein [Kamptonema cortianum]MDL5053883.1 lactate/malate dehydrogenase family protein [Oscillatoria laete-virens NRMC-F 0139]